MTEEIKHQLLLEEKIVRLKRKAKILIGIGSFFIFVSWMSQNFDHKQRQDEFDQLYKDKINISFNEINKNSFSIFKTLIENIKGASDESLISAYYGYCLYANTLHLHGVRAATDDKIERDNNQKIYDDNMKDLLRWKDQGDIKALKRFVERLSGWENDNGQGTVAAFQNRYLRLKDQAKTAAYLHLLIYIVGASVLGWAFVVEYNLINMEATASQKKYKADRLSDKTEKTVVSPKKDTKRLTS